VRNPNRDGDPDDSVSDDHDDHDHDDDNDNDREPRLYAGSPTPRGPPTPEPHLYDDNNDDNNNNDNNLHFVSVVALDRLHCVLRKGAENPYSGRHVPR